MNARLVFTAFAFWQVIIIAFIAGLYFHTRGQFTFKRRDSATELDYLLESLKTWPNGTEREVNWRSIIEIIKAQLGISKSFDQEQPEGLLSAVGPTTEYEVTRRRITTEVNDLMDYLRAQLQHVASQLSEEGLKAEIRETLALADEHKNAILHNLQRLSELDGYKHWRNQEHHACSNLVQRQLTILQNPKNCSAAKKLLCDLEKTFGWGNKLHHVALCLLVAYGSGRTLIFNWTSGWNIEGSQWSTFFKPFSENCLTADQTSIEKWPGTSKTQVLYLQPYLETGIPSYWPQAIPRDISSRLERLHGHPFAWLYGQFLKYILIPQPYLEKIISKVTTKLGFQKPSVGVHVRRTDKKLEAQYHNLSEYMEYVESFYNKLEMEHPKVTRRVYLATDDPDVLKEAQEKYPTYHFISNDADLAKSGALTNRKSNASLEGIILDVYFLSLSDYLVCTFTSNVCRLVYEMMQSHHPDVSNAVRSIDIDYFVSFQRPRQQEGIYSHYSRNPREIDVLPGDGITFKQKHFNGFTTGFNHRTHKTGLYPSFKVADRMDITEFAKYPDIRSSGE